MIILNVITYTIANMNVISIFSRGELMSIRRLIENKEICLDFLDKLEQTNQVYIVGLDVPLSITGTLFQLLEARRKEEAEKRGIPEIQFEIEDILGLLLGLPSFTMEKML